MAWSTGGATLTVLPGSCTGSSMTAGRSLPGPAWITSGVGKHCIMQPGTSLRRSCFRLKISPPKRRFICPMISNPGWECELALETLEGEELTGGSVPLVITLPQTAKQICKLDFSDFISQDNLHNLIFIADLSDESDICYPVRRQLLPRSNTYPWPIL